MFGTTAQTAKYVISSYMIVFIIFITLALYSL